MASTDKHGEKTPFGKRPPRHDEGLAPCPFCGSVPVIVENAVGGIKTVSLECACTSRDACYVQFTFEDESSAIMFWKKLDQTLPQDPVLLTTEELPAVPEKTEATNESDVAEAAQINPWSKKKLAQKLLAFKEKRGLSFTQLESLCGISNRTLCHIGQMESASMDKRLKLQRYIEGQEHEDVR